MLVIGWRVKLDVKKRMNHFFLVFKFPVAVASLRASEDREVGGAVVMFS